MSEYLKRHPSQAHTISGDLSTAVAAMMERREMARRALTIRVLGYMVVPIICVLPGVVSDIVTRARPDITVPAGVELFAAIAAGLMGTFNTMLIFFDPSVVSVVFWPFWKRRKDRKRREKRRKSMLPTYKQPLPPVLRNPEMEQIPGSSYGTQEMVITTTQQDHDHGLEFFGHLVVDESPDLSTTVTSTIGYNAEELAEIFHGL